MPDTEPDTEPVPLDDNDAAVLAGLIALREQLVLAKEDVDAVLTRVAGTFGDLRTSGKSWGEILIAAPKPLAVTVLHQRINDIVSAASALRRAEVATLLAEGVAKKDIAEIFGITHQRVSQLTEAVDANRRANG